jgi:hypothetical protein
MPASISRQRKLFAKRSRQPFVPAANATKAGAERVRGRVLMSRVKLKLGAEAAEMLKFANAD